MPSSKGKNGPRALAVLVVTSMLLGALPVQLFLAPALGVPDAGEGGETRGLLPSTESFSDTSYRSRDTDNNSKRDAIEVRYTVQTTAISEQVRVLIKAEDSNGNTVKFHYENLTAFLFGNQEHTWTFYAYYTGRYRLTLTLYDSQDRQEDTDASGFFSLDTGTVRRWITVSSKDLDLDNDGYEDDVEVHVANWTDSDVNGAQVWINGSLLGKTNASGLITGRNYPKGWINIDVFWKELHNSTAWYSEGDGTIAGGLTVRAEPYDQDGDDLEDDVVITVRNQLNLPVRGATVTINRTNYGTTDVQGEVSAFNFRRGFWIVNVTKLNQRGSTSFFSEGMGPGSELNEYFFDIDTEVLDLDRDDRENDLRFRFDVDVDPPVQSTVTVWVNMSHWGNGTAAYNVSTTFDIRGIEVDWSTLDVRNVTYGMYLIVYTLLDTHNNTEDMEWALVSVVRPSNHINVETGIYYDADDQSLDDALFTTYRVDEVEPNITIALYNETGVLKRQAKTSDGGRRWFRDLPDGIWNWTAKDEDGRLVEKGRIVIGARVQVDTMVSDLDFDGFYDDFVLNAYNNVDRGVSTVTLTVWAPNGTEVTSNRTLGGSRQVLNLTKGTYEFNATYLGEELVNGTFYSYGNVYETFSISVLPSPRDLDGDGRYDDANVSVVDLDDSPMELAKVYVDGVYRTLTDLNGYAEVKDLAWGLHTIEAHYSGEVAKARFFSEGKAGDSAKWTMLFVDQTNGYVDDLWNIGSTNETVILYFAASTPNLPRVSHLWLVLPGGTQEIDLARFNMPVDPDGRYSLDAPGLVEGLLNITYRAFPATNELLFFQDGSSGTSDEPQGFLRRVEARMTALGEKADLMVFPYMSYLVDLHYELKGASDLLVGTRQTNRLPIAQMARKIVDSPSTTARQLGELAVDGATGSAKDDVVLMDLTKVPALVTAIDDLMKDLAGSYPDEGWAIQDARNASGMSVWSSDFAEYGVDLHALGDELASRLGSSTLQVKAATMRDAVAAVALKGGSSRAAVALTFPNSTDYWEGEGVRDWINASELARDTSWDEFLDAFWVYRNLTIYAHATPMDDDSSGRENDVEIYVNDTYGRAIAGADVYIDRTLVGQTNPAGFIKSFNYTRGIHLVNVSWAGYEAETNFFSEGTVIPNQAPTVAITDPEEDDEVGGTYSVQGTASDPDGFVSRVDVRIDGGSWQTAIGRSNWRYDWNTRDVDDGEHFIEARSYDGDKYSTIDRVNVTVFNPVVYEDILLVDDDGGQAYEVWFTQALLAAGRTFDTVEVARNADGPPADRLAHAKVVIWFTGEEGEGTLTSADRAALATFLDAGGALFLTGQDIGRDLTGDGASASSFMRDYLRADFVHDNANDYDLIGVPNEAVSEGMNISIEGGTGAPNQNYPSEIQPRTGASVVYLYNQTAEAAVKYGTTVFRTVYFAFGFEGISTAQDRNRVMESVLEWLESNQTTGDNLPPVANAGNDMVTTVGEVAILRGTGSDPDGLVSLFEWDVDGDDTYDWSNDTTGVVLWTYDTAGNYTAKLKVTDNWGDFSTDTVSVEVRPAPPNQPPVADAGDDVAVDQGDPVEFVMSGYDPDGSVVLYEWDFDGDGEYDEESAVPKTTLIIYYEVGVYSAKLRVTDDQGATGTDVRLVTVREKVQNQPPVANAGPNLTGEVGEVLTFVGTGYDADGWIVSFRWDFDGDGNYDWNSDTTGTARWTYTEPGTYTARLLVRDNNDTAATDTTQVVITEVHVNEPPTADAGPDDTVSAVEGEEVEFHGTGEDPDGYIALYEWDFDGDGEYDWSGDEEQTVTWVYDSTGLYIARLRVTDDEGASDTDTVRVSVSAGVSPNEPPTADAGGPYQGVAGVPLQLVGKGSDPDGSVVSYEWDFEGDGTVDHHSPASGTTTVVYEASGVYTAVLYVTDDDGAKTSSTADVSIERANEPPTVKVLEPTAGQVVGGYFVIRGTATDDTGVARVQVRVDEGTWMTASGTLSWSYDFDMSTLAPGAHMLSARAVDVRGDASRIVEVQFMVEDTTVGEAEEPSILTLWWFWVMVLLVVVPVGVAVVYALRYRSP